MKRLLFALSVLSAALLYADVPLMKNGEPVCTIIPAQGDDPTIRYAAEELSLYLGKIGGGKAPAIADKAESGRSSVVFQLDKNPKIHKHGFQLETKGNTLYVRAQRPLGLLYGAYEILKKYGGIRWIHPGPQGEFFKVKSEISVPDVSKISNPSFEIRTFHFGIANWTGPFEPAWDWMVRNNMNVEWDAGSSLAKARPKMYEHALKLGATWRFGWHSFTRLHMGYFTAKDPKQCIADYRKMFQEHPERFALIDGKRQDFDPKKNLAFQNQPCSTNPDNIKIIAHNLVATIRKIQTERLGWEGRYFFSNNDNTHWCQCPDCRAAADPRESRRGIISTRYWKFANAVAAEARKEMPDLPMSGVAYQNFHPVPLGVKPDPKLPNFIGFNSLCYRHKIDDPNCPVNKIYCQYYKDWGKVNLCPNTWEEVSGVGFYYQALEFIYADHLKTYRKLGIRGTCPSVDPMLAGYGKHLGKHKFRYENTWRMMWQLLYMAALLQWDIDTDVEKAWEEANALYYGAAWENGMREYRKLQVKTSENTAGCFGYSLGSHTNVGRCLSAPGVEAKLLACLDRAEKAVQNDPRALAAVQFDRFCLTNYWIKPHQEYMKNVRRFSCYKTTGKITLDGKLSEDDWKKADIISGYTYRSGKEPKHQTAMRLLFDDEFLYAAIEAMEPETGKMVSKCTKHDGEVWRDNSVELFINCPAMKNKYYHLIVNDKGTLQDTLEESVLTDPSFESKAQIAVGKEKDRWIVEMKIPMSALGEKILSGQTWRFNGQRYRVVEGEKNEGSGLTEGGRIHDVSMFLPVTFTESRSRGVKDNRDWRNTDFSEWRKLKKKPAAVEIKDDLFPVDWILNTGSGKLSMETRENNPKDKYAKFTDFRMYQPHKGTQKKFKVLVDAKGTGKLKVYVNRYQRGYRHPHVIAVKGLGSEPVFTAQPSPDRWQTFSGEYTKHDAQEILGFVLDVKGEVCVDNMFVLPVEEGAK